jgi:methionine synthase II (cobalamin-independent)
MTPTGSSAAPRSRGPGRERGVRAGLQHRHRLRITFAECPDLPYLPELPARGSFAQLVGRGTAFLSGLSVDLQPAGWRLTDGSGRDHRLAKSTVRSDLDELEEAAQGYVGPFKFAFAGPWTLAAMMERPRGDRVLADSGARRDLGQSLTAGITEVITEMRRRLPELRPIVQLDEPALPSVVAGAVPTASGFSRHRAVKENELREVYTRLVEALGDETIGAAVVVHCCATGVPITLLHDAGVRGISLDLDQLTTADWDAIGAAMEDGMWLGAGALPTSSALSPDEVSERVLRPVRALGLEPAVAAHMLITPACGLALQEQGQAVRSLRTVRTAAEIVTDQLEA